MPASWALTRREAMAIKRLAEALVAGEDMATARESGLEEQTRQALRAMSSDEREALMFKVRKGYADAAAELHSRLQTEGASRR